MKTNTPKQTVEAKVWPPFSDESAKKAVSHLRSTLAPSPNEAPKGEAKKKFEDYEKDYDFITGKGLDDDDIISTDIFDEPPAPDKEEVENKKAFEAIEKTAKRINFTEEQASNLIEDIRKDLPINAPDKEWEESNIEKLRKEFVQWRKSWLKKWNVSGCPGGKNIADNTYLMWNWFSKKLLLSKDQEADRRVSEAIKKERKIQEDVARIVREWIANPSKVNKALEEMDSILKKLSSK